MNEIAQALANRLVLLKSSPGFNDLVGIVKELELEATASLVDFAGWDKDQIASLKSRAQAAKELCHEIFIRIDERILAGASSSNTRVESAQADTLRNTILEADTRIPGTY